MPKFILGYTGSLRPALNLVSPPHPQKRKEKRKKIKPAGNIFQKSSDVYEHCVMKRCWVGEVVANQMVC